MLLRRASFYLLIIIMLLTDFCANNQAASAAIVQAPVNVLLGKAESYSAPGSVSGSIVDNDSTTYRNSYDGTHQSEAWYAVTLDTPTLIDKVVYAHGHSYVDGGWFDTSDGEKPRIQIQTELGGAWNNAGILTDYPATDAISNGGLIDGQEFELSLIPVEVYGVRILGKPVFFASAAELQAFDTSTLVDPNVLSKGVPSNSRALPDSGLFIDSDETTFLSSNDGTLQDTDWYAVQLSVPVLINNVIFTQGPIEAEGGWFDSTQGKPTIQVRSTVDGDWQDVGQLFLYPDTTAADSGTLAQGQRFETVFDPIEVFGVRVIGVPANKDGSSVSYSSIADLLAYNDPLAGEENKLRRGSAVYSRAGNAPGSLNDGDLSTVRNSWNGQIETEDWYAVMLDVPQLINKVVFAHGVTSPDGGWFNTNDGGKPKIQMLSTADGAWIDLANVDEYPATSDGDNGGLQTGQSFSIAISPTVVYGVRVIGRPANYPGTTWSFTSIAELQAYYELPPREYVPLNTLVADTENWTGGAIQQVEGGLDLPAEQSVTYTGDDYLSAAFHFRLNNTLPLSGSEWSSISIRAQGDDSTADAYILVLKEHAWELQKRTQRGTSVLGSISTDSIVDYSTSDTNEVLLASYDVRDGVRLQLSVNGEHQISILDSSLPIRGHGYFGADAGGGTLTLSGISEGMPVNLLLEDTSNWVGPGTFTNDGNHAAIAGSYKLYKGQKFSDEFLDFTMRYSFNGADWPGISLRGTDASKSIFEGGSAYFIDMDANKWEVQKWVNGNRKMLIGDFPGQTPPFGTLVNKQFLSDTEHTVRAAAIQVPEGIRLLLYVDGQKVFDIVDEDQPLTDSGYFGIYAYSGPVTIGSVHWETASQPNKDKDITLFDVPNKNKPVVIDNALRTVAVEVTDNTDLSNMSVTMNVSRGAAVSPLPATVHDYTEPVTYTITAEDGSAQEWIITIITESDAQSSYMDIADHPAKRDIIQLHSAGIMNGLDEMHFGPDSLITRIDLIAAVAKAASLAAVEYSGAYSDVVESQPYAGLVQAAYDADLLFPTNGGLLLPQSPATKEEMTYLFARAAKMAVGQPFLLGDSGWYRDSNEISSWAREEVEAALGTGLIPQAEDGFFHPSESITRGDTAVYLRRLLYKNKPFSPMYNAYSAQLLDAFQLAEIPAQDVEEWTVQQTNGTVPMNGMKWNEAVNEQLVYQSSIKHNQDEDKSWELRIGKGGQIYSLDTAVGELIAPQTVNNLFMDEVIQPVSISYDNHNPDQEPTMYFIHGSGVYYKNDPILTKPFYNPMMAYNWNAQDKSYSVAAWGQNAQIPSIWRSGILYYTKVRDAGDGIIEVSYVLNNFGTDTIDDISIPWGGVRKSVLPDHIIGNQVGTFDRAGGVYTQITEASNTGGWAAMTQNADDPDSFTLATVFGKDQHSGLIEQQWGPNYYTWGDANRDDFYVQAVQGRFHLRPGEKLAWKFYYVLGKLNEVTEKANSLVSQMDYGFSQYDAAESDRLAYYVRMDSAGQKVLSLKKEGSSALAFETFAQPVEGSQPLFLLRNTETNQLVLSMDPLLLTTKVPFTNPYPAGNPKHELYEGKFQYKPYDGKIEYIGILGYVYPQKTASNIEQTLITLSEALQGSSVYQLLTEDDQEASVVKLSNASADEGNPGTHSNPSSNGVNVAEPKSVKVMLEEQSLSNDLAALPNEGGTIVRQVNETGDYLEIVVPASFVYQAITSGKPVTLTIKSPIAQYDLPLQGLQLKELAQVLLSDMNGIKLQINIGKAHDAEIKAFGKAISNSGAVERMAPLEFSVIAIAGDQQIEIHDFGGVYITRSWMIDLELNENRLTALWLTSDGEARFAPATFHKIGDQVKVTVKRPGNSAYTVVEFNKTFEDVQNHWAKANIEQMASKWIVKGVAAHQYRPDKSVTRAEWTTLLVRSLGLQDIAETSPSFKDVKIGAWYAGTVATALQAGLINGFEDGSFKPDQAITRQELAVMTDKALQYIGTAKLQRSSVTEKLFKDQAEIASWANQSVLNVIERELLFGRPDGTFAPNLTATRAEAATVLYRLLKSVEFIND
jgi:hypothetical protein